jgi:hypothetical protein
VKEEKVKKGGKMKKMKVVDVDPTKEAKPLVGVVVGSANGLERKPPHCASFS